ncbi:hypothetical protein AEA09_18525 [Lysinibacillus contaminans]|uniref:Competence protein CoiA n=1 Tax=Lysinibacillus contaminans TaxID=1293441 RepID=A0ABR5JXI9_9BACI|nr:competence protein CoiA family protein [Lysinibacillus contaminans]KOS66724.1 hypothetical protein AEA09_18525 [Lysinibacillus contaminans]
MLIAITEKSQRFISYEYTRNVLQQLRQQGKFYCPQCQQPVQLKIGTINIPHFAHIANQACDRLFAEGESVLHLKGKIQLFEWLKKLGHTVELEPYLSKLAQRPDILLTKQDQLVAVEFQCSSISYEKWRARTDGYKKERIEALWLFQTPPKKSSLGIHKISITPLMQQVITRPLQGLPYIVTFDANTSQFIYWSNLLHLQGHTFITKVQCLPSEKQGYPFFEPKSISKDEFNRYWQLYKKTGEQYVYQRLLRSKKGVQDPFLRSCYEMSFSLESMPPYVGLPVKNSEAIPCFSIEWQTMLHYFCRQLQLQPHELCKGDIQLFLHQLGVEPTAASVQAVEDYSVVLEKAFSSTDSISAICEQVYVHLFAIDTVC